MRTNAEKELKDIKHACFRLGLCIKELEEVELILQQMIDNKEQTEEEQKQYLDAHDDNFKKIMINIGAVIKICGRYT